MTQCFGQTLQAGHGANGAKDVGRVTPLPASGLEQCSFLGERENSIKDAALSAMEQQSAAKLAQKGAMKAEVGVHASGMVHRDKGNTKQGRRDLRSVMVEVARAAVQAHPYVAIARKLLMLVWEVWSRRCADRRADVELVAFKMMMWAGKLKDDQRGGLNTRQFVRMQLMRLGIGADLTGLIRGGYRRRIASVEEVLALCPELRASPDAVVSLATHQE